MSQVFFKAIYNFEVIESVHFGSRLSGFEFGSLSLV